MMSGGRATYGGDMDKSMMSGGTCYVWWRHDKSMMSGGRVTYGGDMTSP